MLDRDSILQANDIEIEELEISEWGGTIYIKSLTGKERDKIEQSTMQDGDASNFADFRARFAVAVVCDVDGTRLFKDNDIQLLTGKSATSLQKILDAGMRLSHMTDEDVEELVGNSEDGPSIDSGSH